MEVQTFDDVFDAIANTPVEAASMKARADLLGAPCFACKILERDTRGRGGAPGRHPSSDQRSTPGKLGKFSLDALVDMATAAGLKLEIRIAEAPDLVR